MIKATISVLIIFMASNAYAAEFFINSELKTIQVIKTDPANGIARLMDKSGNKADVHIGDQIAIENAVISEIDTNAITVEIGDIEMILTLIDGFGEKKD